jgi:exosortase/archaeosortase
MPRAAERLAVNTGTLAVIAACAGIAAIVLLAGRIFPPGKP